MTLAVIQMVSQSDVLANLADYLGLKGYTVDCAQDGLSGLHLAATEHYDLIVLDIMLPGIDGYTLCKRLREDARRDTPVIMLTARDQLDDRLQGFKSGADDYLLKPFALSELAARIEAVLRRAQGGGRRELQVGDLKYDLDTLEVTREGRLLKLNPVGLKLLAVLMQKSPHVLRREVLEEALWGDDCPDSDSLRSHVHQLRQVIDKPFDKPLLQTVHGVGYRLAMLGHDVVIFEKEDKAGGLNEYLRLRNTGDSDSIHLPGVGETGGVLPISPTTAQAGRAFALHPQLAPLKSLFDNGRAAT